MGFQTKTDIAQPIPACQLIEKELCKLIPAVKFTGIKISTVTINALFELIAIDNERIWAKTFFPSS